MKRAVLIHPRGCQGSSASCREGTSSSCCQQNRSCSLLRVVLCVVRWRWDVRESTLIFPSMCARQGQATQEGKTTSCLVRDNSPKHLCLFLQPLKRCSSPGHSCGGFWVRGTQAMGVPHVLAAAVVRERWGRARGPRKAWCVSSLSGVTEWHFKDVSCSSFP